MSDYNNEIRTIAALFDDMYEFGKPLPQETNYPPLAQKVFDALCAYHELRAELRRAREECERWKSGHLELLNALEQARERIAALEQAARAVVECRFRETSEEYSLLVSALGQLVCVPAPAPPEVTRAVVDAATSLVTSCRVDGEYRVTNETQWRALLSALDALLPNDSIRGFAALDKGRAGVALLAMAASRPAPEPPTPFERQMYDESRTCPNCGGGGFDCDECDGRGEHPGHPDDPATGLCRKCGGTGKAPTSREIATDPTRGICRDCGHDHAPEVCTAGRADMLCGCDSARIAMGRPIEVGAVPPGDCAKCDGTGTINEMPHCCSPVTCERCGGSGKAPIGGTK